MTNTKFKEKWYGVKYPVYQSGIGSITLRKSYESHCPNSFVQEQTTTKFLMKWRRGMVGRFGERTEVTEENRERNRKRTRRYT
ncbi:hypothetical protein QVD17_20664 [Tagetes erecta]|uniref:Uncharacterized protein n=1 Tax=Tagetes erecta TaxID=13708 RepID=A0AAD8NXG0_TARER|nr:hypothetical protein QVD17_20664 [Tagetes erecta]